MSAATSAWNIAEYAGEFKCSECGAIWRIEDEACEPVLIVDGVSEYPRYCQYCGKAVGERMSSVIDSVIGAVIGVAFIIACIVVEGRRFR